MSDQTTFRPMVEADILQLHAFEEGNSERPWSQQQLRQTFNVKYQHSVIMMVNGELMAYLLFSEIAGEFELLLLGVNPQQHRCGYGRKILTYWMDSIEARAEQLFLEVREGNVPAMTLYESLGFCQTGLREHYYSAIPSKGVPSEHAVIMGCQIGNPFQ